MPSVRDVLMSKTNTVHAVNPTTTVLAAVQKMNQHKIGALLVMKGQSVVGMFTERDVLRRVIGEQRDPASVAVGEVMTEDVICVGPEADIDEVSTIMSQRKVRHIPVCDEKGNLHGMVSIGDVNAFHADNQQAQIHFLHEYVYGRA